MEPSKKSKSNKCCLEKCKQKGKYTKDMLRCCSCNIWCHYECVGEDPATPGIWNCHECSQAGNILHSLAQDMLFIKQKISSGFISLDIIPEQIKNVNKRVDDLTNEVKSLQTTNTQLISELSEQHKLNSDLKRINTELESKIAQNYQDKENKLSPNQSCKLLIGSSIIRDIVPTDTQKIKVCSHSGASVQDITRALDKESYKFDEIIIVTGGNDCDNQAKTVTDIKDDFVKLCSRAKQLSSHVKVASVLPRPKPRSETSHLKSDQINRDLKHLCASIVECEFVDNNVNFTLSDNSANDALYLWDGVHLNSIGSKKLMENLKLSELVNVSRPRPVNGYKLNQSFPLNKTGQHRHLYQNVPRQIGYRQVTQNTYRPSFNQNRGKPVCWSCGKTGHKIERCYTHHR